MKRQKIIKGIFWTYAVFCMIFTSVFIFATLLYIFWPSDNGTMANEEMDMVLAFGQYKMNEYPQKGTYFNNLALKIEFYSRKKPLSKTEILKYLGKPDLMRKNKNGEVLVYICDAPTSPFVHIERDRVKDIVFAQVNKDVLEKYERYPDTEGD